MKLLYAIQGTGNGHIARARELVPAFAKWAQVDVLISGTHCELELGFELKYKLKGMGFRFGKGGGIDYIASWKESDARRFAREVRGLDLTPYTAVINDFEPVSAWAARFQKVPCIGLSNQSALIMKGPERFWQKPYAWLMCEAMHWYAPCSERYGFDYFGHSDRIFNPVIAAKWRRCQVSNRGHYLVYLPAYSDRRIIKLLSKLPQYRWVVFSKHATATYTYDHIAVYPIASGLWDSHLAECAGVLCSAGFGTTTEALFLGKKLLVVPMSEQYEQKCNAHALAELGIPAIPSLSTRYLHTIDRWLASPYTLQVQYSDAGDEIAKKIVQGIHHADAVQPVSAVPGMMPVAG